MESNTSELYNICHTIKEIYKNYDEKLHSAYNLLLKMLNNIITNPNEQKFRLFKLTNDSIKAKILCIHEIMELLYTIGYTDLDKENLVFKNIKTDSVKKAIEVIGIFNKELEERLKNKQSNEKNEEIQKKKDEINKMMKEEHRKKEEIMKQIEYDKQERLKKPKATDSIANQLKYGAVQKKLDCKDPKG